MDRTEGNMSPKQSTSPELLGVDKQRKLVSSAASIPAEGSPPSGSYLTVSESANGHSYLQATNLRSAEHMPLWQEYCEPMPSLRLSDCLNRYFGHHTLNPLFIDC